MAEEVPISNDEYAERLDAALQIEDDDLRLAALKSAQNDWNGGSMSNALLAKEVSGNQTLQATRDNDISRWALGTATEVITDPSGQPAPGWYPIRITRSGSIKWFPSIEKLQTDIAKGDRGVEGASAGQIWVLTGGTADADPGNGKVKFNADRSFVYIDNLNEGGEDVTSTIDSWDNQPTAVRLQLTIKELDTEKVGTLNVIGVIDSATSYRKVPTAQVGDWPAFSPNARLAFVSAFTSDMMSEVTSATALAVSKATAAQAAATLATEKAAAAQGVVDAGASILAAKDTAVTAATDASASEAAAAAAQTQATTAASTLGYLEKFATITGLTKQSATGVNPSSFVVAQASGGGIDFTLSSQSTICLFPTRFNHTGGARCRYRASWSLTSLSGTNCRAGLSIGATGANVAARRHYVYRGDGLVYRVGDSNTGSVTLLPADSSRVYGVGQPVSLQLDVDTDGTAVLTATAPDGSKHIATVGEAIPEGVLWVNDFTYGSVYFASVSAERVATFLTDDLNATKIKVATNTSDIATTKGDVANLMAKRGVTYAYPTTAGLKVERTLDGASTGITFSTDPAGGLAVSVSSGFPNRIYCVHNGYSHDTGVDDFKVTATISSIGSTTVAVGLAFGAGYGETGNARKSFVYRSDGTVFSLLDGETTGTIYAAADARLVYAAGATVSLEITVDDQGVGKLSVTNGAGEVYSYALTGVPTGKVWTVWRGYAAGVIKTLAAQGYPSILKPSVDAVAGLQVSVAALTSAMKRAVIRDGTDLLSGVEGLTLAPAISGASIGAVTVAAATPGVRFASAVTDSFSTMPTGHVYDGGEASYEATVHVDVATSLWAGLTIGDGDAKRTYAYSVSGSVFWTPWAYAANVLFGSGTSRQFAPGDTIKIKLAIEADRSGVMTITTPLGATFAAAVTDVPAGSVGLARRGVSDCTFTQLTVSTIPAATSAKIGQVEASIAAYKPEGVALLQGQVEALERMLSLKRVRAPIGFGFQPDFPIYRKTDGSFAYGYDHLSRRPCDELTASNVFFVDPAAGSDSNAGTEAAPFATLYKALHNVAGSVFVRVKPGVWDVSKSAAGATIIASKVAIQAWGAGKAVFSGHFGGLVWTATSGQANVYQATLPATMVGRAWDATHPDADGLYSYMTGRTSVAQVTANADSYFLDGSTLYVRTFDDRAPDAGIRVYADVAVMSWAVAGGVLWCDHVAFEGGAYALRTQMTGATRSKIYMRDGWARYAWTGAGGAMIDGPFDCIWERFTADKNRADGHNYHGDGSLANAPTAVELDSGSTGNGYNGGSNNSSTMHDAGLVIRLATPAGTFYRNSEKRPVHDINSCRTWNLGITVGQSRNLTEEGASIVCGHPTSTPETSRTWLDSCAVIGGSTYALATYQGATIYTYNLNRSGVSDFGTPTLVAYTPEDLTS